MWWAQGTQFQGCYNAALHLHNISKVAPVYLPAIEVKHARRLVYPSSWIGCWAAQTSHALPSLCDDFSSSEYPYVGDTNAAFLSAAHINKLQPATGHSIGWSARGIDSLECAPGGNFPTPLIAKVSTRTSMPGLSVSVVAAMPLLSPNLPGK